MTDYRSRGYDVSTDVSFGSARADVVARSSEETLVFGVGAGEPSDSERLGALSDVVSRTTGARFRLVLVGLPKPIQVEVERVEEILTGLVGDGIYDLLSGEATHFTDPFVEDVEYARVQVRDDQIEVGGSALLNVTLQYGSDGDVARDDGYRTEATYPLRFHMVLSPDLNVEEVLGLTVAQRDG